MRHLVIGALKREVTKREKSAKSKEPENVLLDILVNCQFLHQPFKIWYCKRKSTHIWQQESLGNVIHMVREMAILFCYCLGPFVGRSSKNEKSAKLFFSISRPNLNGFNLSIQHWKDLPKPVKIRCCDQKSINVCKGYEVQYVWKLVHCTFQAALANFLISITSSLKSFEDMNDSLGTIGRTLGANHTSVVYTVAKIHSSLFLTYKG